MKISEAAKLTGVTVRTLHYYDEIGLLKPDKVDECGYRLYSQDSLLKLQQILFFRELDFPLKEIKEIMMNPGYDKMEALNRQRELLIKKKKRLDNIINLIEDTIKGEVNMSFKEFDIREIEEGKKQYAEEVKKRWGKTSAYKEYEEKTKDNNQSDWNYINEEAGRILKEFSRLKNLDPASKEVQDLVIEWQNYITNNFYNCTKEILSCLGLMYVQDERFKENIDKNGEGTAKFLSEAIKIYCLK